ncbi:MULTISPECIES: hypothetical protein [Archaea]|uniref:hypothetical protein n=1 Tax=Bacteria TaxID=2 RepID=UPI003908B6BC
MKYKYLLGILLLTSFLILVPTTNAVTASQIGANQIVLQADSHNWAGVIYSDYWSGIGSGYNPIIEASETIHLNLSISYIQNNLNQPDDIGIWVGLSPYSVTYTGSSNYNNTFLQAGYNIFATSSAVGIEWFIQGYNDGKFIYSDYYTNNVPTYNGEYPSVVDVFLQNLGNGTAVATFFAHYPNGQNWQNEVYVPWNFSNKNALSAYSIVESPGGSNFYYEIPGLYGGMIQFGFVYQTTNIFHQINQYEGPGSGSESGTDIQAVTLTLVPYSGDNNQMYVSLENAWPNNGEYDYSYYFYLLPSGPSYTAL